MFGSLLLEYLVQLQSQQIWQFPARLRAVPAVEQVVDADVTTATVTPIAIQGTIAPGTQRVPMLQINIQVPCFVDSAITSFTLKHSGLGDVSDIQALYITQNGIRVNNIRSIPKSGIVEMSVRGIVFAPCTQTTLFVTADFAQTASPFGEHQLELQAIQSSLPVDIQISSTIMQTMPSSRPNTVEIQNLSPNSPIGIGKQVIVDRIQLRTTNATQQLQNIVFTNLGSAENTDLVNFYVTERSGAIVSQVTKQMSGDHVVMQFNAGFTIEANTTRELFLRADYLSSRRNTIDFIVEAPADIISVPLNRD